MIICISANPAIDQRLRLEELRLGKVNRALSSRLAPGGKAAHVAMVARALGSEVLWVGFLGGATGVECERGLTELGIELEVVHTKSSTRINQEIIDRNGIVTEILEAGGRVDEIEINEMSSVCSRLFDRYQTDAQVVISGSLPPGLDHTFYVQLIRDAHARGCFVALDTSGPALTTALPSSPDLIKPNREEAEAAFGFPVNDDASALQAAREFIAQGAKSVALSLGSEGLLWLASAIAEPLMVRAPAVKANSTVGCGDAALAGLTVGRQRQEDALEQAILAVACGAANCLADSPGMIDVSEVARLKSLVRVESLAASVRDKTSGKLTPADVRTEER